MTEYPTPRDAIRQAVADELTPAFTDAVLDRDDHVIRLLGVDAEDRAVYYSVDSGRLLRYEYQPENDELELDGGEFIGRSLDENDPGYAFTWLTEYSDEELRWVSPRYRWLAGELDELSAEQTA